jgi:hypothetical protein
MADATSRQRGRSTWTGQKLSNKKKRLLMSPKTDRQTDWPSVTVWLWLWLHCRRFPQRSLCIVPSLFTSALRVHGGEWSAFGPCRFTPGCEPQYPWNRRLSGPQRRSDAKVKRKISCPCWESNHNRSSLSLSIYRLSYPDSIVWNVVYSIVTIL